MKRGVTLRGMVAAFVSATLLLLPLGFWSFGIQPPGFSRARIPPPSIALIQAMSDLATTKVHIADAIEGANGHYKGRWSLHGEVVLGVDLSKVSYLRVDATKKEATLLLPSPHLISSKIDFERAEELYVKAVAWLPYSSRQALRDEVWKMADRKIQRLGQEPGHVERAKVQAERVLHRLFDGVGWNVRFAWDDETRAAPATRREIDTSGAIRPGTVGGG